MDTFRGIWQLDEAVVYLEFTTNGSPRMATVECENDQFILLKHNLHIAKRNEAYYLSLQAEPKDASKGHLIAAFKPRNTEILVWTPDEDFFKNQIESEKLKGTVRNDGNSSEIMLTDSPERILELLSTTPDAIDREDPLVFRKLE